MVDISTRQASGLMPSAAPSGPKITSSTARGVASMVSTMPAPAAASAGVGAAFAPAASSGCTRPGVRFHTVRS